MGTYGVVLGIRFLFTPVHTVLIMQGFQSKAKIQLWYLNSEAIMACIATQFPPYCDEQ
jgi:hypothetical protein